MSEIVISSSSKLEKYNSLGIEDLYFELVENFIKYNSFLKHKDHQLQDNYAHLPASPVNLKVIGKGSNSLQAQKIQLASSQTQTQSQSQIFQFRSIAT